MIMLLCNYILLIYLPKILSNLFLKELTLLEFTTELLNVIHNVMQLIMNSN